jgi:hypothetical protein
MNGTGTPLAGVEEKGGADRHDLPTDEKRKIPPILSLFIPTPNFQGEKCSSKWKKMEKPGEGKGRGEG